MAMHAWEPSPESTPEEERRLQDLEAQLDGQNSVLGSVNGAFTVITKLSNGEYWIKHSTIIKKDNLSQITEIRIDKDGKLISSTGSLYEHLAQPDPRGNSLEYVTHAIPAINIDQVLADFIPWRPIENGRSS